METGTIIQVKTEDNSAVVKVDGQNFGAVVSDPGFIMTRGDRISFTLELSGSSIVALDTTLICSLKAK